MTELTHLDREGHARMVDVSAKDSTERTATAKGSVYMRPETLDLIQSGGVPKGDVIAVARVAGIMAAKRTSDLIPLCHPLGLASVTVELTPDPARQALDIAATCKLAGKTGVEMEALTAVSVACLTIYDMLKAVQKDMEIGPVRLLEKSGGRSGHFVAGKRGAKA